MKHSNLASLAKEQYRLKKRLVAPLMGMPGLKMINSTIKLGQQNFRIHYEAIKALADLYQPDIVFPLMDLSVEANAIGRYTLFPLDDTATLPHVTFNLSQVKILPKIDITADTRALGYAKVTALLRRNIVSKILKGVYVTGPYTLAALILGAEETARSVILDSQGLHALLDYTTKVIENYTELLIESGAQIVCILEPSASMLSSSHFEEFSGNYVKQISALCAVHKVDTVYHVCGNTTHLIKSMAESGVSGLSLDSPDSGVNLPQAITEVPEDVVIIGNINPVGKILTGSPFEVKEEVNELLESVDQFPNFILSTGCDLPKNTPIENIEAFMKAGREYRISAF
ncbi:MAG: uroporphyrinogen decarboxylase family protein [Candidatus Marinimicrobia bacterium]|nr:uroporphyrinogen decarboxylase family protein [Candidatus Neomarinimicrobiota bacterium]